MGLAHLYSRALTGMDAQEVVVEVHVAPGLPSLSIVGLPDTEVKESRDRVRSAIQNSGFDFPARRITVNLAPADLPKDSGRYDLAIALGILCASQLVIPKLDLTQFEFAGELALDGSLRKITGALAIAHSAKAHQRSFILPLENSAEAKLINEITILPATHLIQVIAHLTGTTPITPAPPPLITDPAAECSTPLNFNQVRGQIKAKHALEIAASGRHSLLMIGSPGCGKSMLAQRITTILPSPNDAEALAIARIQSLAYGSFTLSQWGKIPWRAPHHSSSHIALVGGGSNPKPGEISLAHHGVLFLDEIPEFDRKVLEVLREPIETKHINIARARHKVVFPADFQLIAAMNPCPCGNSGHPHNTCRCTPEQIARYVARLSAPLLDRIDLIMDMPYIATDTLNNLPLGDDSKQICKRVINTRTIQLNRQGKLNYALDNQEIAAYCILTPKAQQLLLQFSGKAGLSPRSYYKVLRISRTIADSQNSQLIDPMHIAEAIQYKQSQRPTAAVF